MVSFTSIVAAATVLFAAVASAAPSVLEARQLLPSVKYCVSHVTRLKEYLEMVLLILFTPLSQKNTSLGGACVNTGVVSGQCLAVQDGFDNTASSMRMDSGVSCTIYCDAGCTGSKNLQLPQSNVPDFSKLSTNMVGACKEPRQPISNRRCIG